MAWKKEWTCTHCGEPTDEMDKVCLVCRTDTTSVKGTVSRKDLED